jgi:hypothetical protein
LTAPELPAAPSTPAASPPSLAQKSIYPVRDSTSYLKPYFQRDHAWTDKQHDQSNEVTWSKETNTTAADHIDWVVNEQGEHSRLYPAAPTLAQQNNGWVQYKPIQSKIVAYNHSDDAWTAKQAGHTNEIDYKQHIQDIGADYLDSALTAPELPAAPSTAAPPSLAQKSLYPAEIIAASNSFAEKSLYPDDIIAASNSLAEKSLYPADIVAASNSLAEKSIYPVRDSTSYLKPYFQRDHAWTDKQHDQSNEVTWSKETNTTAADHIDWVVNEQGEHSRLYPAAPTLAQKRDLIYPVKDSHSYIKPYNVSDHAWTENQHHASNEVEWSNETNRTAADTIHVVNNTGPSRLVPSLVQKSQETYPAKDSHSYITPYYQRDHAWTDKQHDQSNEVTWSGETNITAADHIHWLVNEQGEHSRLYPAAANTTNTSSLVQQQQKYRVETHSIIIPYVVRDNAWNFDHHDNSNFTAYKESAPAGYIEHMNFTDPVVPDGASTPPPLLPCTTSEEAEYAAEVIANERAGLPKPVATCLTKAAAAANSTNATCSAESPTCHCSDANATNGTNGTNTSLPANTTAAGNSSNSSKVCKVINATNATNSTNASHPSNATKVVVATPANVSKIGVNAKKIEVPKVTAPAANKPAEVKKIEAKPTEVKKVETAPAPAAAAKVEIKKTETKAAMPPTQTAAPVVVKKPEVNHSIVTPVKEAAK